MFVCCHYPDSGGKSESPEMFYGLFNKPTERQCGGVSSGFAKLYQDPPQTHSAPNDTSVNETLFCPLLLYALLLSLPLAPAGQLSTLRLIFYIILEPLNLHVHSVPGHACVCTHVQEVSSTGSGNTRKLVLKPPRCRQSRRNSLHLSLHRCKTHRWTTVSTLLWCRLQMYIPRNSKINLAMS